MIRYTISLLLCFFIPALFAWEDNQTREFAAARAERISDITYHMEIGLEKEKETFDGKITIGFELKSADTDLVIDFVGESVNKVSIDETAIEDFKYVPENGRLIIPAAHLTKGKKILFIDFTGKHSRPSNGFFRYKDKADQREYMYTDFEPNAAHRMFPCFDQPDLKATFQLEVLAPPEWEVITNTQAVGTVMDGDRKHTRFKMSAPFSTYLFHLSAGPFASWSDPDFRVPLTLYCRQSKVASMDHERLFETTRLGFDFFEEYFDIPYPFEKYDQIFAPRMGGAMENVGAVTWSENFLYSRKPDEYRLVGRDLVLLHELAHMWFGDLVTMKWWDGLWLKESFADYLAHVAAEGIGRQNPWSHAAQSKRFVMTADQKPGTHPILATIPDVRAARRNFDAITYTKGLAALRQLDYYMGDNRLRDALRIYLKENAWGNTELEDLMRALRQTANIDTQAWVDLWLATTDLNTIRLDFKVNKRGKITRATLIQEAGDTNDVLRPHATDFGLFYENDKGEAELVETIRVTYDGASKNIGPLKGRELPAFVIPNMNDYDYTKVVFDPHSLNWLRDNMHKVKDTEVRKSVWTGFYGMVRDGRLSARFYLDLALARLPLETDSGLTGTIGGNCTTLLRYAPDEETRLRYGRRLLEAYKKGLAAAEPGKAMQATLYTNLGYTAYMADDYDFIAGLISGEIAYEGTRLSNRTKWQWLSYLAVGDHPKLPELLSAQKDADSGNSGKRQALMIEGMKPDLSVKEATWKRLMEDQELSRVDRFYLARSLFSWKRPDLAKPFLPRFFDMLAEKLESDDRTLRNLVRQYYPGAAGEAARVATEEFLKRKDLPEAVRIALGGRIYDLEQEQTMRAKWNEEPVKTARK
ncbi:MAG: aminopeptidase N [Acidobacteriota bacterium]|nr:aminopeptidase N [Acidobacteriota bacterium]